jgi:hypothetical protein
MLDVHRQWLEEFERKAAIRRALTARSRDSESERHRRFRGLLRGHATAQKPPAVAGPSSQAQQCA